jgi:ankyrin repeat protein
MACRNGHAAVVQLLVEAAPDKEAAVNAADSRGQTPLHYAASMPTGGAEVVSYLLQQGSKGEAVDNVSGGCGAS